MKKSELLAATAFMLLGVTPAMAQTAATRAARATSSSSIRAGVAMQ
ncbi:hypothetical protein [uncultured Sphingomonas sp.]